MPPTNATSSSGRPGWRSTTNFWWCDPPGPHPHVEQALAAGRLDLLAEMPVLLLAEREPVQVRAPDQSLDDHAAGGGRAQRARHLRAGRVQHLVGIAAPVGEHHQVAGPHPAEACEQLGEVGPAMNQRVGPRCRTSRPRRPGAGGPARWPGCRARSRSGTSRRRPCTHQSVFTEVSPASSNTAVATCAGSASICRWLPGTCLVGQPRPAACAAAVSYGSANQR